MTTQRLPERSKAILEGNPVPKANEMVTAGEGSGVANWALVNSTRVLLFTLAAHKSPEGSNLTVKGPFMPLVKLASGLTSPCELGG